jgi:polyhydroxyalkanoate synthesis repressor PhaR
LKLLKKYPNRRIYDTETSSFVTLSDVRQLVIDRVPFQVIHSKSGEDLTRGVLLQIISEMEGEGHESLLTNRILLELIRFYGDRMVGMMAPYLEQQILQYLAAQDQFRNQFAKAFAKPFFKPDEAFKSMMDQYLAMTGRSDRESPRSDEDGD